MGGFQATATFRQTWGGCDGCSSSPDRVFGVSLVPACWCHDWAYGGHTHLGGTARARKRIDQMFRRNVKRCLYLDGKPPGLAEQVADLYYAGVRAGGAFHFRYSGGLWRARLTEAALLAVELPNLARWMVSSVEKIVESFYGVTLRGG